MSFSVNNRLTGTSLSIGGGKASSIRTGLTEICAPIYINHAFNATATIVEEQTGRFCKVGKTNVDYTITLPPADKACWLKFMLTSISSFVVSIQGHDTNVIHGTLTMGTAGVSPVLNATKIRFLASALIGDMLEFYSMGGGVWQVKGVSASNTGLGV